MHRALGLLAAILFSWPGMAAVTQSQYEQIIWETQQRLAPWVLERFEKELLVTGDWAKNYTPASAGGSFYQKDGKWGVHIVGWVAREPEIDRDGLRLIFCHELGHHVEGRGAEVESDYFAASACAPHIFQSADALDPFHFLTQTDREDCRMAADPQYCERVMNAVNQTNRFRADLWELQGSLSADAIEETVACRRKASLHGVLGLPMIPCPR